MKTPVRGQNDSPTPEASHIKFTPLVHRYDQESPVKKMNTPPKASPEKSKRQGTEGTGTRSRARKSRKERMSQAANNSLSYATNNTINFSNAVISAH